MRRPARSPRTAVIAFALLAMGSTCDDCISGCETIARSGEDRPKRWIVRSGPSTSVEVPYVPDQPNGRYEVRVALAQEPATYTDYTVRVWVTLTPPQLYSSCADCGACPEAGCTAASCACASPQLVVAQDSDATGAALECPPRTDAQVLTCEEDCVSHYEYGPVGEARPCGMFQHVLALDTADPRFGTRDPVAGTSSVEFTVELLPVVVPTREWLWSVAYNDMLIAFTSAYDTGRQYTTEVSAFAEIHGPEVMSCGVCSDPVPPEGLRITGVTLTKVP